MGVFRGGRVGVAMVGVAVTEGEEACRLLLVLLRESVARSSWNGGRGRGGSEEYGGEGGVRSVGGRGGRGE